MKKLQTGIAPIYTDRLILIPFTTEIIISIQEDEGSLLKANNLVYGVSWPDDDAWETFPKIKKNLAIVTNPTGFESWMIVKKEGLIIIGDAGFKGMPNLNGSIDIGYAIIESERKQGYVGEAVQGLINWAFNQKSVCAITASCLISNLVSQMVLNKFGFNELRKDNEMIYWIKNR